MLIKLDSYESAGTDGIHPLILKQYAASFSGIVARIFKNSYITSIVPLKWKSANITRVFKKGSKCDPANYRPISLTSIPCKMMERILRDAILKHLIDHGLIASEQHGFVPFKSCITNLLEKLDIISDSLNKGSEIILIFLDFAKAFDKVSHNSLLVKLAAYGFDAKTINWIKAFLSQRIQRVVLGEHVSEWKEVTSGVPQGSVIGPLLFVIFINDKVVNHILKLYADDSKLIGIIKDLDDQIRLQSDIDALVKWSQEHAQTNLPVLERAYFYQALHSVR